MNKQMLFMNKLSFLLAAYRTFSKQPKRTVEKGIIQ